MKKLFFLIGSSASGKTTAAKSVERMALPGLVVRYSDSERVPPVAEMVERFGSQEEWQRENTYRWVKRIRETLLEESDVVFDVQSRPSFVDEACQKAGVADYAIVLFDCADEERRRRLVHERNQPELAHEQMMNWAKYLREQCAARGCPVVENTSLTPEQSVERLLKIVGR